MAALWALMITSLASGLATAPPAGASPDPSLPLAQWGQAKLALPNGAVAYDGVRHQLLVAVSGTVPTIGNSLVEVDPLTGALGRTVTLGSEPSVLAVSDDGSRAYVGFLGASVVTEVDLQTFTVVRRFALGTDSSLGPMFAEDIEVQPGHPDVIAVSRRNSGYSPRHEGVGIYDDGVMRPTTTAVHTGANRIAFASSGTLYGYNNETTGFGFYTMSVDATGVRITSTQQLLSGFYLDIEYAGGVVASTNGRVVDPPNGAIVGTYNRSGAFEVDALLDRTYYQSSSTLYRQRTSTLLSVDSVAVPMTTARQLVDTGVGLAAADASSVLLLGPGVTGAAFQAPAAPSSVLRKSSAVSVAIAATALVGSPDGDHLYAVTGSSDAQPYEAVEVDPVTGARGRHVFVGAAPNDIEVSSDGRTLIIGHADANRVTEVDVDTFTVRRRVTLPSGSLGAIFAGDIDAVPGSPDRYTVETNYEGVSPALYGAYLVVDGTLEPKKTPNHTGPVELTFAGDPAQLYGMGSGGLYTISVAADGLTVASTSNAVTSGYGTRLESSLGLLLGGNGAVIDPRVPALIGTYPKSGLPVALPAWHRMFFAEGRNVHELEFDNRTIVASATNVLPESVVDAVAVGPTLAAAGATKLTLIPLAGPPRRPVDLEAVAGDHRVTLAWGAPADDGGSPVTAYRLYRDGTLLATTADGDAWSFVDESAANGTRHRYAVAAVNANAEGPKTAEAAATPQGPLTGRVSEDGGGAVAGAWVLAIDQLAGRPAATTTDPGGAYTMTVPPGDRWVAFIDPSGEHRGQWYDGHPLTSLPDADTVEVTADGATADAVLVGSPGRADVAGRVTDEGTGDPVGGAWVALVRADDQRLVAATEADGDGRYALGGVARGRYLLVFIDPSGAHRLGFWGDDGARAVASVLLLAGGDVLTADAVLPPADPSAPATGAVTGTVADGSTPLSGVWVAAIDQTGRLSGGAVTGVDGTYRLDLPDGEYWIEAIDPLAGHPVQWYTDGSPDPAVLTVAGGDLTADIDLVAGGTDGAVAGRVADGQGAAVSGALVSVLQADDFSFVRGAIAAADGGYRLEGLAPGHYVVVVVDPSGDLASHWVDDPSHPGVPRPLDVTAGSTTTADATLTPS